MFLTNKDLLIIQSIKFKLFFLETTNRKEKKINILIKTFESHQL